MLVVQATLKKNESLKTQIQTPLQNVNETIPPTEEDEVRIFEELESLFPDAIPLSIDGISWNP